MGTTTTLPLPGMSFLAHFTTVIRSGGGSCASVSKQALHRGVRACVDVKCFPYASTIFRGEPFLSPLPGNAAGFSSTASTSKQHEPPLTKLDYQMDLFPPERIRNFSIIGTKRPNRRAPPPCLALSYVKTLGHFFEICFTQVLHL